MAARALLVLPILTIAAHSGYVYVARQEKMRQFKVETPIINQRMFRPAETNEVLSDALQTGDIVLFKRRWYLNYLPLAAAIVAYRSLTRCEFDHAGVILVDQLGSVWIVERSFLSGLVCRKFPDRLKNSQSELITLIPLLPRDSNLSSDDNEDHSESINPTNIVAKIIEEGDKNRGELFCLTRFIVQSILPGNYDVIGPHVDLVQRFYRLFQIKLCVKTDKTTADIGNYEKVLDLKLVEDRSIELVETKLQRQLQLAKQNINIQT